MIFCTVEVIKFTKELEDTNVDEIGVSVTLECELSKKDVKVEWTKDGKTLRRDDNYDIIDTGKLHQLVIEKVSPDHAGKYSATYDKLSTEGSLTLTGEIMQIYFQQIYYKCK